MVELMQSSKLLVLHCFSRKKQRKDEEKAGLAELLPLFANQSFLSNQTYFSSSTCFVLEERRQSLRIEKEETLINPFEPRKEHKVSLTLHEAMTRDK